MQPLLMIAICAAGFLSGYGVRSLLSALKKRRARRRASRRQIWQAATTLAVAAEHRAEAEDMGAADDDAPAPIETTPHPLAAVAEADADALEAEPPAPEEADDLFARLRQTLDRGAPAGQASPSSIGDLWRVGPHVRASAERPEPWQHDPLLRSLYRPGKAMDGHLPRPAAEDRRKPDIRVSRRLSGTPPRPAAPVQQLLPFAEQKSRYPAD